MHVALHPHFTAADDRQTEVNAMMRKYDINGAGGLLGAADMCARHMCGDARIANIGYQGSYLGRGACLMDAANAWTAALTCSCSEL